MASPYEGPIPYRCSIGSGAKCAQQAALYAFTHIGKCSLGGQLAVTFAAFKSESPTALGVRGVCERVGVGARALRRLS